MEQDKLLEQIAKEKASLEEKLQETIDSLRAIKGEEFAELIRFISGVAHTAKMMGIAMREAPEAVQQVVAMQYSTTGAIGTNLIVNLLKLQEKEIEEVMGWSDTIGSHVEYTMDAIGKLIVEARKSNDNDN